MRGLRAVAVALLAWVAAAAAQEISVRVTPRSPIVADLTRVDIEVKAPRGIVVELPDTLRMDCAEVTKAVDAPAGPSGGRVLYKRTFTLELSRPGTCVIPGLPVQYGDATLSTRETRFQVRS